MTEHEYLGVCARGHRSYLRLVPVPDMQGRCPKCAGPAELSRLPPVSVTQRAVIQAAAVRRMREFDETADAVRATLETSSAMVNHQPTPLDRAIARMMAMEQIDEDLARSFVERTFLGQVILFQEQARELGRVIARTARADLHRVAGWLRR